MQIEWHSPELGSRTTLSRMTQLTHLNHSRDWTSRTNSLRRISTLLATRRDVNEKLFRGENNSLLLLLEMLQSVNNNFFYSRSPIFPSGSAGRSPQSLSLSDPPLDVIPQLLSQQQQQQQSLKFCFEARRRRRSHGSNPGTDWYPRIVCNHATLHTSPGRVSLSSGAAAAAAAT